MSGAERKQRGDEAYRELEKNLGRKVKLSDIREMVEWFAMLESMDASSTRNIKRILASERAEFVQFVSYLFLSGCIPCNVFQAQQRYRKSKTVWVGFQINVSQNPFLLEGDRRTFVSHHQELERVFSERAKDIQLMLKSLDQLIGCALYFSQEAD